VSLTIFYLDWKSTQRWRKNSRNITKNSNASRFLWRHDFSTRASISTNQISSKDPKFAPHASQMTSQSRDKFWFVISSQTFSSSCRTLHSTYWTITWNSRRSWLLRTKLTRWEFIRRFLLKIIPKLDWLREI
jgi:hypothetical protein